MRTDRLFLMCHAVVAGIASAVLTLLLKRNALARNWLLAITPAAAAPVIVPADGGQLAIPQAPEWTFVWAGLTTQKRCLLLFWSQKQRQWHLAQRSFRMNKLVSKPIDPVRRIIMR